MNVGLPPEPLPFVLAVAPSGTAIVSAATIPSTRPRPPRPHSAFARRPLRPHIALERTSPLRDVDPHSAFPRVSLRGLFESFTVCLSPFLPRIPARAAVPMRKLVRGRRAYLTLKGQDRKITPTGEKRGNRAIARSRSARTRRARRRVPARPRPCPRRRQAAPRARATPRRIPVPMGRGGPHETGRRAAGCGRGAARRRRSSRELHHGRPGATSACAVRVTPARGRAPGRAPRRLLRDRPRQVPPRDRKSTRL